MTESKRQLHRYWIIFDNPPAFSPLGIGCGVTAYDYADAVSIMNRCIPETIGMTIKLFKKDVQVGELDGGHVIPNMGVVSIRGIWFPML